MTLQQFLVRLIWLCVAPVVALAVWLAWDHVGDLDRASRRRADETVQNAAGRVDAELRARASALQMLVRSPLTDEPARLPDLYREAQGYASTFGSHVVLAEADGMVFSTRLALGDALPPLPRPRGRSAVELAIASGRPAVGDLFVGPLAGTSMVAMAASRLRPDGSRLVMLTTLDARLFERVLGEAHLPEGWALDLRDTTGEMIARRGPAATAGSDPAARARRHESTVAFAAWPLVLTIPEAEARAATLGSAAVMVGAVLGVTLSGVLGGTWAARRLARAVRSIAERTPAPPGEPEIAEITAVRRLLADAGVARERAEAEQLDSERGFRQQLERASIALQVREAQLRGIFESASDAIVTTDQSQTIVIANAAAAAMFRTPVERLIGSSLEQLIPERYRVAHRAHFKAFGETGHSARRMGGGDVATAAGRADAGSPNGKAPMPDLWGLRSDGEEFPIDASISHVHVDGQRLYTVVLRDFTRLRRAQAELKASHAALQRLVAAQDSIQEGERKRIARELHDDLQQTLAAIMIETAAARGELPEGASAPAAMLERIDRLARTALESTRRIVADLRPQTLEELGLVPALRALAAQFSRRTGIACGLEVANPAAADGEEDIEVTTCLYRVAQEALTNAAKHAGASRVSIVIDGDGEERLTLAIEDDGRGMRPEDRAKPRSFGLVGMRERVHAVGGTITVQAGPGEGTRIGVEVPLGARRPVNHETPPP